MESSWFVLYASFLIISLLYIHLKQHYSYWKRRNVPGEEPHLLYGNFKGVLKNVGLSEVYARIYKNYKGKAPFTGYFQFMRPSIIPTDLELIKNILVKDFNNFRNRGLYYNRRDDPLSAHMAVVDDDEWRILRTKLSPTFTPGKIKLMFSTMMDVGNSLVEAVSKKVEDNPKVDMKVFASKYSIDMIGMCAFGIECNTLKNKNSEFGEMAEKAFHFDILRPLRLFTENFPRLARFMGCKRFPSDITSFYFNVVKQTIAMRQNETTKRKDFIDTLMDLLRNNKLSLEEIAAHSFFFFVASLETTSTSMLFSLYELACNQTIQDKLRQEINDVINKHNGQLTYEGISEMTYLKKVVSETTRKHSTALQLIRMTAVDYPTNDPKYIIPKGTLVTVPVHAIHNDPQYYPNPEVFNPERFSPEEIGKRHPMAYLPFGQGPRNCIAARFAKMEIYIALTMLIKNFKFYTTQETLLPMEYSKTTIISAPIRPIILKVQSL